MAAAALAAVIDLFGRQVVGWTLQLHMQASVHGQKFATREQARQAVMD